MFYIHPWEFDPQQPRIKDVGWKSRFRHYVGLARTEDRLRRILGMKKFAPVTEVIASWSQSKSDSIEGAATGSTKLPFDSGEFNRRQNKVALNSGRASGD